MKVLRYFFGPASDVPRFAASAAMRSGDYIGHITVEVNGRQYSAQKIVDGEMVRHGPGFAYLRSDLERLIMDELQKALFGGCR